MTVNLCVKLNNQLVVVGTARSYTYDNETFVMVERVGMFDTCYNLKSFEEFLKDTNFIIQ